MNSKRLGCWGIVITLFLFTNSVSAAEQLVLNGSGTRQAFFFDLYTCKLYTQKAGMTANDILNTDSPVRVAITVHGDPLDAPPDHWARVLRDELSDRMFRLTKRTFRNLEEGDRVIISYTPGSGTNVDINEEDLFTDPGRSLIAAILEQWIGEQPVSDRFKADLLGEAG